MAQHDTKKDFQIPHKPYWKLLLQSLCLIIILFAGAHGPSNIEEWLIYGFSGLIFLTAYLKIKRLEVPIIIHMLGNILATFQNYFW